MSEENSAAVDRIAELFKDPNFIAFVRKVLPELFQQLQIDYRDGDKPNPAVGIPRQKLLTAMFEVYSRGSTTEDMKMDGQRDIHIFKKPISVKSVTAQGKGNTRKIPADAIKFSWGGNIQSKTKKSQVKAFNPSYGIIIASFAEDFDGTNHKVRGKPAKWTIGLIYVPQHVVERVFRRLRRGKFLKSKNSKGGDDRGIPISNEALEALHKHKDTCKISIDWRMSESWRPKSDLDLWKHKISKLWDEEE
jgi:hypothetical protein